MRPTYDNKEQVTAGVRVVYVTYGNTDNAEGKGHRYVLGAFTRSSEAEAAGHGQYVGGSDCPTSSLTALVFAEGGRMWCVPIDDIIPLYNTAQDQAQNELRVRALDKLTNEEKRVLGLLEK